MKRPQKRSASPGLEANESFANFVSTKNEQAKEAQKQDKVKLSTVNSALLLEDILNEENIIQEDDDEQVLTTFTQQTQQKSQATDGESQSASFHATEVAQPTILAARKK